MRRFLARMLRDTPARQLYGRMKAAFGARGQSDEVAVLSELARLVEPPMTFVEFGFHPNQFNCAGLKSNYTGLLIDGDLSTVQLARSILPNRIEVAQRFLTLENLDLITTRSTAGDLGILSIDVDGNDYWFLERLIELQPAIVVVEYNASLLHHPIVVPYDPAFDRHKKHPSGWYHGASLTALHRLCAKSGYQLVRVASGGGNAFFVKRTQAITDLPILDPIHAYRECTLRNKWSRRPAAEQWQEIKHMPFVRLDEH